MACNPSTGAPIAVDVLGAREVGTCTVPGGCADDFAAADCCSKGPHEGFGLRPAAVDSSLCVDAPLPAPWHTEKSGSRLALMREKSDASLPSSASLPLASAPPLAPLLFCIATVSLGADAATPPRRTLCTRARRSSIFGWVSDVPCSRPLVSSVDCSIFGFWTVVSSAFNETKSEHLKSVSWGACLIQDHPFSSEKPPNLRSDC
jgi:hypothetical protein